VGDRRGGAAGIEGRRIDAKTADQLRTGIKFEWVKPAFGNLPPRQAPYRQVHLQNVLLTGLDIPRKWPLIVTW
jgi:hypothetical protein